MHTTGTGGGLLLLWLQYFPILCIKITDFSVLISVQAGQDASLEEEF